MKNTLEQNQLLYHMSQIGHFSLIKFVAHEEGKSISPGSIWNKGYVTFRWPCTWKHSVQLLCILFTSSSNLTFTIQWWRSDWHLRLEQLWTISSLRNRVGLWDLVQNKLFHVSTFYCCGNWLDNDILVIVCAILVQFDEQDFKDITLWELKRFSFSTIIIKDVKIVNNSWCTVNQWS